MTELTEQHRQTLLQSLTELEALSAMAASSTATVELDQSMVGRLSRMDAMQNQQMAMESERRRRQQIAAIRAALRRLDEGDYGYCVDCGEEIAEGRLAINPAVARCINCSD